MVQTKLIELLKERNMTQKELSIKSHVRAATISALCNGTAKTISFKILDSLCSALNCDIQDIFVHTKNDINNAPTESDLLKAIKIIQDRLKFPLDEMPAGSDSDK